MPAGRRPAEGFFEFIEKGNGDFHFGYVQGHMDCRLTTREGEPAVEWTWGGNDGWTQRRVEAGPWSRATNCAA
jgi:hypothetical protein